jgi:hypothetical protein
VHHNNRFLYSGLLLLRAAAAESGMVESWKQCASQNKTKATNFVTPLHYKWHTKLHPKLQEETVMQFPPLMNESASVLCSIVHLLKAIWVVSFLTKPFTPANPHNQGFV